MTTGDDGWQSDRCTAPRCRTVLENGQGCQFRDEKGKEQRFCWKHWVITFKEAGVDVESGGTIVDRRKP